MIKKILRRVYIYTVLISNQYRLNKSAKKVKTFYNIHKNERCFIIGNGPSLRVEDLEKLKNEICFGTHRIYNIFNRTDWRPDYYCAQDFNLIQCSADDINKISVKEKFICIIKNKRYKKIKGTNFLELIAKEFYPELAMFSEDISQCVYEGYTVTYMCIQLAVYMGFKEICLLGVDHNYSITLLPNGDLKSDCRIKDHFSDEDKITSIPQVYKSTLAYEAARKYADEHGIKIYNATRGGNLEVFECVDLDKYLNQ